MVNSHKNVVLALQKQQILVWQQFTDQHPNSTTVLTKLQLQCFQQAIMLSDFVLSSALQAPEIVVALFANDKLASTDLPDYQNLLAKKLSNCQDENTLHKILRQFRLQQMVHIAVGDLLFDMPLEKSLERLSLLADVFILSTLDWLTSFCQSRWGTPVNSDGDIQPLLVYGMGKLGGKELNFSSDIDLIFTYPEKGETVGTRRSLANQQFFTRLGQKLITALHQKTADGFVYRVDMRLRPFGESGPLVMSFNAMEDYYQEQGRDWERYAMLKARLLGDSKYHQQIITTLRPFVYRRYIDFSVIDSLRRMKMMISQEVRRKQLINNIKLGAGGIREIEFIVQVFQLIRGGRVVTLQQRHLLTVLPVLVEEGELSVSSKLVLENAYCFLRRVENIIQALADQQTQTLPESELDQLRILQVLNIATWDEFLATLQSHMSAVHQEFSQLIGEEKPNHQTNDQHWLTLWLSQWSDEESVAWIEQEVGFWQGDLIWLTFKHFREECFKRSIGNRGRQVLDKLIPLLMHHLQQSQAKEFTLARIFVVFNKIITRTAYLELLFENEGALKHLIRLCQASAWVSEHIAKYPILLDELIDPKLLHNPPALSAYGIELREIMLRIPEEDVEAQMESLRQFKQAQQLRIAAADISSVLPLMEVSDHLTALAESIISEVINLAWQQISERFGVPPSSTEHNHKGFAVIGYGKLGGRELSYSSDLDLVFLHQSRSEELTNGNKQVAATVFYMKLAQRIMHIFNTRMSSGILYELDMRLRPSGNSGLLVVHIDTFERYQKKEAWTWEHQALVRTRVIYGNPVMTKQFNQLRQHILSLPRDPDSLAKAVVEMRDKMRGHLDTTTETEIDIKQAVGGLVDIEFLAQYLVLNHSHQFQEVAKYSDNVSIFCTLNKIGILSEEQQKSLTNVYCQLRDQGHRAALQNEKMLIDKSSLQLQLVEIEKIWQAFL